MKESAFYDGARLLSSRDLSGNRPEIYICTSNRSAGKTTYFSRYLVNRFRKNKDKFMLIYRYSYELSDCANKFFKDIQALFFPDLVMESKGRAKGIYHELFLNGDSCGYAASLNNADVLKKNAHLFSDVAVMFFDEFQPENGRYCTNEINKFISFHISVARGGSKQSRYVPVIMCGNTVSLINPYYVALGISERLKEDTKILRGDGFVLEQGFNPAASRALKDSAFNRAFAGTRQMSYAAEAVYLNDNMAFIEKPSGVSQYFCTLLYEGKNYAIREYMESGIVYCDDKPDLTNKVRITVTTEDHQVNYVMLKRNSVYIASLRYYFEKGCFRFKNLKCKEAVLKALSY